jgi:hypothetical protein
LNWDRKFFLREQRVVNRIGRMATILQFRMPEKIQDETPERGGKSAQILFFTGVRYERREPKEIILPEIELPLAL